MNCLMIRTKDKRRFFTHERNLLQLLEFSKTFNAEISLVKVTDAHVMDLDELAPAICDANYAVTKLPDYEVLEVKVPTAPHKSRKNILRVASRIRHYIVGTLSGGGAVSLKDLRRRFKRYGLSTPALCNHIRRVREELKQKGIHVCKVSAGKYMVVK